MSDFPRMLYRAGGAVALQDGDYSTLIVNDAAEQEEAEGDGWRCTPADAKRAAAPKPPIELPPVPPDDAPPTRDELMAKALSLGLRVDGRWTDKRIADAIAATLTEPHRGLV